MHDSFGTRYRLVQSNPGTYNWLFIPGGAGADSQYFLPLIENLNLPGNAWLIDFPNNGDNIISIENFSFDSWATCFLHAVKKFENPIIVGHSFGGMFPLLFPELENILKGLILIGATPIHDSQETKVMIQSKDLVIPQEPSQELEKKPIHENFKKALIAQAPLFFPKTSLAQGKEFFLKLPINFDAILWWASKRGSFQVKWVPQYIPTIIIGGTEDLVNPISLFEKNERFKRPNISLFVLEGSGHFPWFENMEKIKEIFHKYIEQNF